MRELRGCRAVHCLFEFRRTQRAEAVQYPSHPEVRLLVIRGPVVHVSRMNKTWRIGFGGIERTLLSLNAREVTGQPVNPLSRFGRSEADDELASAIPKTGHQVSMEPRRTELGLEFNCFVGIK